MAIGVDVNVPFKYVLIADRELPPEQQTVFKIRPMLMSEKLAYVKKFGEEAHEVTIEECVELLNRYLMGWENFKNSKGEDIPFVPKLTKLDTLSEQMLVELTGAVFEVNSMTKETAKN